MLRPQISGLDELRDHLVWKRNDFTHLLSPRFLRPALGPCNHCAKGDRLRGGGFGALFCLHGRLMIAGASGHQATQQPVINS